MKFKAFLQIGLACMLAATLAAPAYAAPEDTPLPGDYQAAPAANPTKPAPAQARQAQRRPAAKKQQLAHHKHGGKHRPKHRMSKKPAGKHHVKPRKAHKKPMHHHLKKHKRKQHKAEY